MSMSTMAILHPLPRGTKVALVVAYSDLDADDEERVTPSGSVGRITGIAKERDNGDEGFCYDCLLYTSDAADDM
jgi:hypothetical protein